jgi:hypothetical protein
MLLPCRPLIIAGKYKLCLLVLCLTYGPRLSRCAVCILVFVLVELWEIKMFVLHNIETTGEEVQDQVRPIL